MYLFLFLFIQLPEQNEKRQIILMLY